MLPAPVAVFVVCLVFFHCSEFLLACIFMRDELSVRSWLISMPYATAMCFAVLEYLVESLAAPVWKIGRGEMGPVAWTGVAVVLVGELIRKVGMLTAQSNFTHNIRMERSPKHVLVTKGIYRYTRHPGYLGWYVWCIGTQLVLCNPISCVVFAVVAWRFFRARIEFEEYYLARFFGEDYLSYAARTPTWIPFIP